MDLSPPYKIMVYNTSNLFFQNIVQSIAENKLIAAVVWIVFMIFILRKIAKKDYELILKKKFSRHK